jgi:glycosyltransferase involved in cell wall biosynthesis
MAKNGILTLLYRRDWTHSYWLAVDLQFCMKSNPESESLHWGDPWPEEGRSFEPTPDELKRIRNRLVDGTRPVISICVSLKNRSRIVAGDDTLQLFPNCVRSLAQIARLHGPIELVVADFHSDDWPLDQWVVENAAPMAVQVVAMEGPFSKGRGLNAAVQAAQSDHLLLLDADMLVSEGAFLAGLDSLSKGRAFFPIIMGLDQDGNDVGWWGEGTGIAFVPKAVFTQVGGIAEFQSWGGEDDLFYEAVTSLIPIDRGKLEGMVHQWHPDHCRHEHYTGAKWEDFDKMVRVSPQPT